MPVGSCDNWNYNSSSPVVFVGGYWNQRGYRGLFYVNHTSTSDANAYLGSRLMKLPDAADLISFTVSGFDISYTGYAKSGMTWGEWINSGYNTADLTSSGSRIYGGTYMISLDGNYVLASDLIVDGAEYFAILSGGGGN